MNDEVYWTLACKVWENKASPAETEQFNAWAQQPGHAAKLAEYRQLWQLTKPYGTPVFDSHANWQELETRLYSRGPWTASPAEAPMESARRRVDRGLFLKLAASLLLIAIAWFYLPGLFAEELITVQTQVAEQKLVVLPDSSHVWLNASSTIRYPRAFSDSRQVYLEGEAFFDVTKDPARPFIIDSKDTETRVLGTSFNVQAVAALPVTVTVVTGKVQFGPLADARRRVILLPGDAGMFHAQQSTLTSKANDNPRFMEWHNRTLNFSKTPLTQVFETLENVYGIRIHTSSAPSKACVFTGAFENAPVEEIFEVLSATVGFEWSGSEKKYQVVNLNCL